MKIGIIGAGAIGLLFSYYLSEKNQITIYTRSKRQAELIQSKGICLMDGETTNIVRVEAVPFELWTGSEDLTIITVKQYHLPTILPVLTNQINDWGSLLFLQNGMGHLKWLSELKAPRIYLGSVEHGAARLNEHTVSHNGYGLTKVAVYRGSEDHLRSLVGATQARFPISLEDDYQAILLTKLIVNCIINPLTATFQVTNGTLVSNPYYYLIVTSLFEEIVNILNIHNREEHFANVLSVCQKTTANQSSMLKDIAAGRETEIDAILGYVLEEANRKQMQAPLTHNYYNLIKGKEFKEEDFR
ncbi:2-dehydropantoate 2-reductase [Mesobacillus maritimus]|uniref:2-dehydropantoate 2-reductase n=1 Tax=Mesobacillus maritimus TaxID=1643336 RepID=A0ABS7K687_9BACI|nr:2-dehydropantoate 2-reductase [Mesobacillus maritimus]MBY0097773.1 2-dehydropantoate 2-reductase [Mesobacillus maritimus]